MGSFPSFPRCVYPQTRRGVFPIASHFPPYGSREGEDGADSGRITGRMCTTVRADGALHSPATECLLANGIVRLPAPDRIKLGRFPAE